MQTNMEGIMTINTFILNTYNLGWFQIDTFKNEFIVDIYHSYKWSKLNMYL